MYRVLRSSSSSSSSSSSLSSSSSFRYFSTTNNMTSKGPKQSTIEGKLNTEFNPIHLEVNNESYMHSVPKGSETHFKVIVVSELFKGKSMIQQHRMVNELLSEELKGGVHALSIKTATPESWEKNKTITPSPNCMGGSKKEKEKEQMEQNTYNKEEEEDMSPNNNNINVVTSSSSTVDRVLYNNNNNNNATTSFNHIFKSLHIRNTVFKQMSSLPPSSSSSSSSSKQSVGIGVYRKYYGYLKGKELIARSLPLTCLIQQYALPWGFIKHYLPPNRKNGGDVLLRSHAINMYCCHPNADIETLLHLLEWSPDYQPLDDVVLDAVCDHGNIDILKLLHRRYPKMRCTVKAASNAVTSGHRHIIDFLIANRTEGYGLSTYEACADHGHLDILKLLIQHNQALGSGRTGIPVGRWLVSALRKAARHGHLNIIEYCYETILSIDNDNDNDDTTSTSTTSSYFQLAKEAFVDIGCEASIHGHLGIIQFIHNNQLKAFSSNTMDTAAMNGYLDMVQFLDTNRTEGCSKAAMDKASENGYLEIVEYLHKHRTEGCSKAAMDKAAENGFLSIVEFLHQNTSQGCTVAAMNYAARNGFIDIVKYLDQNRLEGATYAAMEGASLNGFLEVVEYLHYNRPETKSIGALSTATYRNRLDILEFLFVNMNLTGEGVGAGVGAGSPNYSLDLAAVQGSFEAIKFIYDNTSERCSSDSLVSATRYGHFKVVELILETRREQPALKDAILMAAEFGHLEILKLLHQHHGGNCHPSELFDRAVTSGHLDIVKYIHSNCSLCSNGCSKATMDKAAECGFLSIVDFLHQNRTEGCSYNAMDSAASQGYFDIVTFLHKYRQEGCSRVAMDQSASIGRLDIVSFLHLNRTEGCSPLAIDLACSNKHFEVVSFLHFNRSEGCTPRCSGPSNIIEFLYQHKRLKRIVDDENDKLKSYDAQKIRKK
ncbi:hypothetical protein DFA_08086 [Cavenderia fasciculata]|uniref:BolA family protein n=1 Tax=Cavenderia fasciculata TaxID=261658 RepID=F4Q4Z8_CACFS|nr:uncharacterized protein DFA_08086 [Cavenderia fasciculata]EGG17104.1 hypothetical protein DFA_08086 [Cavenderia fasciculata]|eukprot:XP_004355588.1 hypothetical protein DFA_08086 [Cavenderia fasciculata]